jgi:hypothetical protein
LEGNYGNAGATYKCRLPVYRQVTLLCRLIEAIKSAMSLLKHIALNSTDLAQAGAVFNDATRLLDGGLWSNPADNNNQAAYLGMYTTDINAVLDDLNAVLANPNGVTVSGTGYTLTATDAVALTQVQDQLETLLKEGPLSVGNNQAATTAQELIHSTHTSILNENQR